MRIPKRGEKGFTLIELLIVVAILGVLAAVVIPNVGRFFGRGEEEARRTEFHNICSAVIAMMVDNGIPEIPGAVVFVEGGSAQNQMGLVDGLATAASPATGGFPDYQTLDTAKPQQGTETYTQGGYVLYNHQIAYDATVPPDGEIDSVKLVNYLNFQVTKYYYTCEKDGTVRQFPTSTASALDEFKY